MDCQTSGKKLKYFCPTPKRVQKIQNGIDSEVLTRREMIHPKIGIAFSTRYSLSDSKVHGFAFQNNYSLITLGNQAI